MKRLITLVFLVFALASIICAQGDKTSLGRLKEFARNMLMHNSQFTQEKVYLHLDNDGYLPGETLWFKAYVFKASSLLPTDLSKVLYVELLNTDGQIMERKVLPVTNGRTYGNFRLDEALCRSGFYEIRAYTRAMLNWDQSYIFSRVIPVYDAPEDSVNFSDLTMREANYIRKSNVPNLRTHPEPLIDKNTQKQRKTLLTFYPEGGYITLGLTARVAYKLTDADGLPDTSNISIQDLNGNHVLTTKVLHDGMGLFTLPDSWNGGKALIVDDKGRSLEFALPTPRPEGSNLHTICSADSGLIINLQSSKLMMGKLMGLSVTCRTRLAYFSDITLDSTNQIKLPYDQLFDGVHQVTLFTPEGEVVSERLVWCPPHKAEPVMTIRQNKEVYEPYSPVVLDIELKDAEGNPLRGDFSLSVRDADTEIGTGGHGLATEMLMASELKGYIHNPEYYFEADDTFRRHALDLLLMVQGWRRYAWTEMAGIDTFKLKQPMEDGLYLIGRLTDTNAAGKALNKFGNLNLNFLMTQFGRGDTFCARTDKDGAFAMKLRNFNGDAPSVITITDNQDKRVYADFKFDRNFMPPVLPYEPLAMASTTETKGEAVISEIKPDLFEWTDTIPNLVDNSINLRMVTVTGKRIQYGYQPKLRFQSSLTEDVTKRMGRFYYNIPEELDKYMDEGNPVPQIFDWLAQTNDLFEYNSAEVELRYRGSANVTVVIDGDKRESGRLAKQSSMLMHEYRAMVIVDRNAETDDHINSVINPMEPVLGTSTNNGCTIFLYSKEDVVEPAYYKRGTRWLTLHGYSRCDEFYSPDYRKSEVPTATDHRRTLYWNPSLVTDEQGKANVIFYSNSRPEQRLHLNAQGIAVNGQIFEHKRE